MANPRRLDRKGLRVATVLVAVGVLLFVAGALISGERLTGPAVVGPILAVVTALLLWHSQRKRTDGSDA